MRHVTFMAICAMLLMTLSLTAFSQQNNPPVVNPQIQTADKTFEGQLSKVDATTKTIVVKGADDKEMSFTYSDQTEIKGVDNAPQGLTGKTGSRLKVSYREERSANMATRIEIQAQR